MKAEDPKALALRAEGNSQPSQQLQTNYMHACLCFVATPSTWNPSLPVCAPLFTAGEDFQALALRPKGECW